MRAPIPFRQFAMVRSRTEDHITEEDRRETRKVRKKEGDRNRKMCIAIGCPSRGQRGWCQGYCKKCAPKNGRSRPVEVQKQKKVKVKNEVKRMAETAGAEKQEPKVMAETSKKRRVQIGDKKSKANPDDTSKVVMPRRKNSKPNAKALQCARKADDLKPALERPPGNHAFLEALRTTAHHVRAENEGVIEKAEDAGGKRWSKEVVIVRKLPPITQPTMEREGQRRMGCRHVKALRHRMGNYPDSSYVTPLRRPTGGMRTPGGPQELAELPIEMIMSM